jgi:hypothetical protein
VGYSVSDYLEICIVKQMAMKNPITQRDVRGWSANNQIFSVPSISMFANPNLLISFLLSPSNAVSKSIHQFS